MGDKYNLIDIGNISEPAADVVNNFMDKISNALGWLVVPKNIKPAVIEANKSIIEEISNRQDINPIERAAIVSNYKKIVREYKNQVDIMKIAVEHLNPKSVPENVSNDWITFFFDKVKDVTDDYMKEIWGKILAGEFNMPGTYTKRLLHTLSIMDDNMARTFQKIRSSCFYRDPFLMTFIYRTNSDTIDNVDKYRNLGITFRDLRELDSIGIIEHKFSDFYTVHNNGKLIYGNKAITLISNKPIIESGNVSLTEIGKQICRITEPEYNEDILNICIESWRTLGYNPAVDLVSDNS